MEKIYVNPDHSSQLLVQMSELWRKDKFCDAVLVLRNARFKLHKLVLMAACPGIQATQSMSEGMSHFQISLPDDHDMTAVVNVLDYLYDGAVKLRCDNVHKIQKLANYLQLHSLVKYCMDFKSHHETQDANVNDKNALLIKRIKQEPGTMESFGHSKEKMTSEHISSSSDIMDSLEGVDVLERTDTSNVHADSQTSKVEPRSVDMEELTAMHHSQTIRQEKENSLTFRDDMNMFVHVVGTPSTKHVFIIHGQNGPFPCDGCGLIFKDIEDFKSHVQCHDWNVSKFLCNFCGEGFSSKSSRNKHISNHHGIKGKRCNQCGRQFRDTYCLSRHRCSMQCKVNIVQSAYKAQNCKCSENGVNNNRLGRSEGSVITIESDQEGGMISIKNILDSTPVTEQTSSPSSKSNRIDVKDESETNKWTLNNSSSILDCSGKIIFPCSVSSFGQVSNAESGIKFPSNLQGHIGVNLPFTSSIVPHTDEDPVLIGHTVFPCSVADTDLTNNGSTTTSEKDSLEDIGGIGQYVKDGIVSGIPFMDYSNPEFALVAQTTFPSRVTDLVEAECGNGLKVYSNYNFPVENRIQPPPNSSTYNDKFISGSAEKLRDGLTSIEQASSMVKTNDIQGICKNGAVSVQKFLRTETTNSAVDFVDEAGTVWNFASNHLTSRTHQKQGALKIFEEVMPRYYNHNQKRNIYTCPFCSKEFTTASCRSKHVNLHHVGKGKTCDICGHQFKDNFSLNRHIGTRRCKLNKFQGRIFKKSINMTKDNS